MVSGSVASTRHGQARATQNIDNVIDPTPAQIAPLVDLIGRRGPEDAELYVDDAHAAMAHRSQFNVLDPTTGWKVDLIVRKDRPFSVIELARRQPATIEGVPIHLVTAEDSLLSKLEWSQANESERQLRDAASILAVQGDELDWAYLERWALELGVTDLLAEMRRRWRP